MANKRTEKKKKKKSQLEAEIMMFIQQNIKSVAEVALNDLIKNFKI